MTQVTRKATGRLIRRTIQLPIRRWSGFWQSRSNSEKEF
jgi:hypothetical protein